MHHLIKQALPLSLVEAITDRLREDAEKHGVDTKRHFDARMKTFFINNSRYVADIVALPQIRRFVDGRLENPVVHHSFPLIKGAHAPDTLPHQDAPFWPFDTQKSMFTLWIALETVDKTNGCLRFGSDTSEVLPHERVETPGGKTWCIQNGMQGAYTDVPMERGDAVFFDSRQVHAAFPNNSSGHRYSMKIVFGDGDSLADYWYPCNDISTASYYRHNKQKALERTTRRIKSFARTLARRLGIARA